MESIRTTSAEAYLVRCRVPKEDLGALKFPVRYIRFRDGRARIDQNEEHYVITWFNDAGQLKTCRTAVEACVISKQMGQKVSLELLRLNQSYEIGVSDG